MDDRWEQHWEADTNKSSSWIMFLGKYLCSLAAACLPSVFFEIETSNMLLLWLWCPAEIGRLRLKHETTRRFIQKLDSLNSTD